MKKIEKIIELLQKEIEMLDRSCEATFTSAITFEKNIRNTYKSNIIRGNLQIFIEHQRYVSQKVRRYRNSIAVSTDENYNKKCSQNIDFSLNNEIIGSYFEYTEEELEKFVREYLKTNIDYMTKDLLTKKYTSSTNQLQNLIFIWKLESKQELIKFYESLLKY